MKYLSSFLFLLCPLLILAQPPRILGALQNEIHTLDRDVDMESANWSICVIDPQTGELLIGHNENKSLSTASLMKAVTTASALEVLGKDFQFETKLEYSGSIDRNGLLKGNLFIKGSGDPSLGSWRFNTTEDIDQLLKTWVRRIADSGIRSIEGNVIADATVFDSQMTPGNWSWEDMGNYYGAGAGGINIHENLYRLVFKPGQSTGSSTSVLRTEPFIPNLSFVNEVKTGPVGSGDNAYIFGAPYTQIRYLRGSIPAGKQYFTIKGSIPDPAYFLARRLYETLDKEGIDVSGAYTTLQLSPRQDHKQRRHIYTHKSPFLSELIFETNMQSLNLYAEALVKAIAVAKAKKGATADGLNVIAELWESKGLSSKGMLVRDGSGLSANNAMSTYQIAYILFKMYRSNNRNTFFQSLPVAGRSGTMKGVARGTVAEGRLRAKSGYISNVRSYGGFVTTRGGRDLAFAMIANNYACSAGKMRRKFEKLMVALAEGQ